MRKNNKEIEKIKTVGPGEMLSILQLMDKINEIIEVLNSLTKKRKK